MAFGFSDIGSMFSKGMGQYGQGLDKMRALPMDQKMMGAGQILHGGVSPFDMGGAAMRLGQPNPAALGPAAGSPPAMPGAPPLTDPSAPPGAPPPQGAQDGSSLFMGLLPLLMKNGMGAGLLGGMGGGGDAAAGGGGMGGLMGGGMGGLLGKFGFGGH